MAQYVPPINLPTEGIEHARWLEKKALAHDKLLEKILLELEKLNKAVSAGARPAATAAAEVSGVPLPPLNGMVLRGFGDGRPIQWAPEWQGFMPEYYVNLDPVAGGSWEVVNMGIGYDDTYESQISKAALPPVEFGDGGATMLPIRATSYADALRPGESGGQTPMVLRVTVNPTTDGDDYTIHVPYLDHSTGTSAPFYKLLISNPTAFDASVDLRSGAGSQIFYAGTDVPVMGSLDVPFTLEAGVSVAWHVELFSGISAAATPVYGYKPALTGYGWYDPYYEANVWVP